MVFVKICGLRTTDAVEVAIKNGADAIGFVLSPSPRQVSAARARALVDQVSVAVVCYVIYSFIFPLSTMGASVYLRKIAPSSDVASSLAMGLTMQHAAAVVVPIATGFVLNYVGYQIPFLVATVFAAITIIITRKLDPANQKSPRRLKEDAARLAV